MLLVKHQGRENDNVRDTPATLMASVPSVAKKSARIIRAPTEGGIQSGPVLPQTPESERRLPEAITFLQLAFGSSPGPAFGIPMT